MSPDTLLALLVIPAALALFGTLLFLGVLVARDTVRQRGRWGINLSAPSCPRCGEPMPTVRAPRSFQQALWGGWNCPECGLELDKWGRPVDPEEFVALDRPTKKPSRRRRSSSEKTYRGDDRD